MLPACVGAPGPNMAALEGAMLCGASDESGWSGMVIKCKKGQCERCRPMAISIDVK